MTSCILAAFLLWGHKGNTKLLEKFCKCERERSLLFAFLYQLKDLEYTKLCLFATNFVHQVFWNFRQTTDLSYLLDYRANIKLAFKQKLCWNHKKLPTVGLNICYSETLSSTTFARKCLKNIKNTSSSCFSGGLCLKGAEEAGRCLLEQYHLVAEAERESNPQQEQSWKDSI